MNLSTSMLLTEVVQHEAESHQAVFSCSKKEKNSGTYQWAKETHNLFFGCENGCKYCYARPIHTVRFKRIPIDKWREPIFNSKMDGKHYRKVNGRIMFPSTHDITEATLPKSLEYLKGVLSAGNDVLIVSKPHLNIVKTLCQELAEFKKQITFRFSIGSADDVTLKFWEPYAPTFAERVASLKHAYDNGFQTSVSCEPMLDGKIDEVIDIVRPYVNDSIWLGLPNRLKYLLKVNKELTEASSAKADELLATLNDDFIKELYAKYSNDSVIKWKESIQKILGIERLPISGLEI